MGIANEILTVQAKSMMNKNRCGHGTIEAFCFYKVIKCLELEETLEIVLTYSPSLMPIPTISILHRCGK